MKLGDIVKVNDYEFVGEVVNIDEKDKVTVRIGKTGSGGDRLVLANINDLEVLEDKAPDTVNILGTPYQIIKMDEGLDAMDEGADGWCDPYARTITLVLRKPDDRSTKDLEAYRRKVLRHEIIHAFLHESGIWHNSSSVDAWAMNEEMVDWMAGQMPKIYKAFEEAGCNE